MTYCKRVLSILAFSLGLILLLSGFSLLFLPKNNQSEFGMEEVRANGILGEREDTIDVMVVGDSEAYSSISPMQLWRETGYTAYVAATSGQTLDYSFLMVQRAFQAQKPKLVILETNAVYREIPKSKVDISMLGKYFSVFLYHDRWKDLAWTDLTEQADYTWTDDYKGYRHSVEIQPSKDTDYKHETQEIAPIPKVNLSYVEAIRDLCQENGAQLLLLRTPSTLNWSYAKYNGILDLAEELDCPQMDMNLMNDQLQIDWNRDTRDAGDHLNAYGAAKVTRYLAGYLQETGLFQDHRSDLSYSPWQEALKRYEAATGF